MHLALCLALCRLSLICACCLMFLNPLRSEEGNGPEIHNAWPLIESTTLPDGKHYTMVLLFLYHRTANPDGTTHSWNLFNFYQSPEFTGFLPFFYRAGAENAKHTGIIPLWFQGPGYGGAPLLLSGGWERTEGGKALWITPFFHANTTKAGEIEDLHLLNYFQGSDYHTLFPLYYRGGDSGKKHTGIIPLFFAGPEYWTIPLALSGGWTRDGGGSANWITPLFHLNTDPKGKAEDLHVGPFFWNQHRWMVFPLAWNAGSGNDHHFGLLPLWMHGPDYWGIPGLLSWTWKKYSGGRSTWITPLFHLNTDAKGSVTDFHFLNYFQGDSYTLFPLAHVGGSPGDRSVWVFPLFFSDRDGQSFWPLYYNYGQGDHRQLGIVPFWFQGKDWWCSPLFLSGGSTGNDGSKSTWMTPFYHQSQDSSGQNRSTHFLTWFSGQSSSGANSPDSSYQFLFPLWYRSTSSTAGQTRSAHGLIPIYFATPDSLVVPPALSAQWTDTTGSTQTWITPLFHRKTDKAGELEHQHLLTWFQGRVKGQSDPAGNPAHTDYSVLFPLGYQVSETASGSTTKHSGIIPFWFSGKDYGVIPPLLSMWSKNQDGGDNLWITPLFHRSTDATGTTTNMHALNYIQSGDIKAVVPLFYKKGPNWGLIPLWFQGSDSWFSPPLLSGHSRASDGSESTWITPLAHWNSNSQGKTTSLHVLNYFQGEETQFLFPLAYRGGPEGQKHSGILPLAFWGPEYWTVPLGLSGGWKGDDGGSKTWITPLFHYNTDSQGKLSSLHFLNYLQGPDTSVLFPLAWFGGTPGKRHHGLLPLWLSGPDYTLSPVLLSGHWKHSDGGNSLWITPLFHRNTNGQGEVTDWHALNYFHSAESDVLFPLFWSAGKPNERYNTLFPLVFQGPDHLVIPPLYYHFDRADGSSDLGLIPLWFQGKDYWTAPLLLSGSWTGSDGRSTSMYSPLFHRTSKDGNLCHQHILNYISTPEISTLFPLYWDWKSQEASNTLLLPLYYQHSKTDGDFTAAFLPGLFSYHSGKKLDTSFGYQCFPFLVQNTDDGHEINVLWRLFHLRSQSSTTEFALGPLWWSQKRPDTPLEWQLLTGLLHRDCNDEKKTSQLYCLWLIPLGGRSEY